MNLFDDDLDDNYFSNPNYENVTVHESMMETMSFGAEESDVEATPSLNLSLYESDADSESTLSTIQSRSRRITPATSFSKADRAR